MMFILITVVIEEDSSAPALPTHLGLPDPCQHVSWSSSENFGIFLILPLHSCSEQNSEKCRSLLQANGIISTTQVKPNSGHGEIPLYFFTSRMEFSFLREIHYGAANFSQYLPLPLQPEIPDPLFPCE